MSDKISYFVPKSGYYLVDGVNQYLEEGQTIHVQIPTIVPTPSEEKLAKEFYSMFYKTVGAKGAIHSSQIWEWFKPYVNQNAEESNKVLQERNTLQAELEDIKSELAIQKKKVELNYNDAVRLEKELKELKTPAPGSLQWDDVVARMPASVLNGKFYGAFWMFEFFTPVLEAVKKERDEWRDKFEEINNQCK